MNREKLMKMAGAVRTGGKGSMRSVAQNTEDVLLDKVSVHPTHGLSEFVEFSYPKGDLHAVFIGRSDFQLLKPRSFINDTIIDFYMKYLETKVRREEARFHFFNSFFFRKLADLDGDLSSEQEGKAAFLSVRKWTRKLDLFKKDYIFIPVNFSYHWSLIVICQPAEVVNFKDNEMKNLCKVPCILHMDSLRGTHEGLEKLFKSYLLEEWKERHNNSVEDICRRFCDMPFISLELPQQENLHDCGLFLLHYTELFIEQAPKNFNPFKIPESSNFLRKQWFTPAEASSKRIHIIELIYRIADDHAVDVCASDKALEIRQCDGEPKMNNDEILDPRYHTRSPSDRYCHQTYNQSKSIMSPIEERKDSEEQKSATLYRDKEVMATESKLIPGLHVDRENIKKQGIIEDKGAKKKTGKGKGKAQPSPPRFTVNNIPPYVEALRAAHNYSLSSKYPSHPFEMKFAYLNVSSTLVKKMKTEAGANNVKLQYRGKEWKFNMYPCRSYGRIMKGWRAFVNANSVATGDYGVLELINAEDRVIKVTFFGLDNIHPQ